MNGHDMNFLKSGHYNGISTKMVMYAWVYHMLFYRLKSPKHNSNQTPIFQLILRKKGTKSKIIRLCSCTL